MSVVDEGQDNRYCYVHFKNDNLTFNNDLNELMREELPFEDISVPVDHLPMTKDEEEATLPSTVHPSYPYGNPFKQIKDAPGHGIDASDQLYTTAQRHTSQLKWDDLALDDLLPHGQAASLEQLKKELHGQADEVDNDDKDNEDEYGYDNEEDVESSDGGANESF